MKSLLDMRKKYSDIIESNYILRNNKENCNNEDKMCASLTNESLNDELQKSTLPLNDHGLNLITKFFLINKKIFRKWKFKSS